MITLIVCVLALLTVDLRAGDETKPRTKLSEAVQSIVDLAHATAPEIFADTIVRLVEAGKIPQRELQIEWLENAFHAAGSATEPVRLIAIPGTPPDTREMYRGLAGGLGLDAISLQSRILRDLLTVDRAKARELFDQIAHASLDPRPCEDALVADIAPYYEIAAAIAQSAFTPSEKELDEHVQFLAGLLAAAKSPGELAAFAGAIDNVSFTPEQWEMLLGVLSQKLEKIGPDYRSFAVSFNALEGAISRLAEFGRANHIESAGGLLVSLRKYVVAQMTSPRCLPEIPLGIATSLWHPFIDEEPEAVERRGSIKPQAYFDSGDSKAIGAKLKDLDPDLWPDSDGVLRFYIPDFADFLRGFELWTPSGSDVDVLHQKAIVLAALLQKTERVDRWAHEFGPRVAAPIRDRDRVLSLYVELLATSGAQRQNPAEWMWQVKSLMSAPGSDAPKVAEAFRASGNPGLLVYLASSGTSK